VLLFRKLTINWGKYKGEGFSFLAILFFNLKRPPIPNGTFGGQSDAKYTRNFPTGGLFSFYNSNNFDRLLADIHQYRQYLLQSFISHSDTTEHGGTAKVFNRCAVVF
jgi:hypothetical protein